MEGMKEKKRRKRQERTEWRNKEGKDEGKIKESATCKEGGEIMVEEK